MKKYTGVVVPMVSPFCDDLSVDKESAKSIASKLVAAGTIPFLLGSTGEGPSMSISQKVALVKAVAEELGGKSPLYTGISPNSLEAAIGEAKLFADLGATVIVTTLPFYFPIDNNQMLRYFVTLADSSPLPVFLYNMPDMVKRSIPLEVADKLSFHPNIAGIKDSEKNETRLEQSILMWKERTDFSFLIGWAIKSAWGLQLGADGIVPSTGNISPELYLKLFYASVKGVFKMADEIQKKVDYISSLYQKDRDLSHSIPALKAMMSLKGLCSPEVLPPLYRMTEQEEVEYKLIISEEYRRLNI